MKGPPTREFSKPTFAENCRTDDRIEPDHRRIKRRIRPMLGFRSERTAAIILGGIELVHMIRKGQMIAANDRRNPSLADQFDSLAA